MPTLTWVIATFMGVGCLPVAPGTWASALAAILAWYLPGSLAYWVLGFSVAGLWACAPSRVVFRSNDPKQFVMDEVCGMTLSVLWLPKSLPVYAAAFIMFRLFDIWKPWPISRVQSSSHPWSIMLDDLLAGVFANLALQWITRTVWQSGISLV